MKSCFMFYGDFYSLISVKVSYSFLLSLIICIHRKKATKEMC